MVPVPMAPAIPQPSEAPQPPETPQPSAAPQPSETPQPPVTPQPPSMLIMGNSRFVLRVGQDGFILAPRAPGVGRRLPYFPAFKHEISSPAGKRSSPPDRRWRHMAKRAPGAR